jgi:signal transduction histidine kinase
MRHLTIAARATLLVLIALTAMWLATVAIAVRWHDSDVAPAPSPKAIAALSGVLEHVAPDLRPLVIAAATSPTQDIKVEAGDTHDLAPGAHPADPAVAGPYAAVLANRRFSVAVLPHRPGSRVFLGFADRRPYEVRVLLNTGDTLVVDARAAPGFTPFGLPVGLVAGLFGTLIALGALIIMQRATRPLAELAAAADRMDISGSPAPLPPINTRIPEIRTLISAMSRLQARVALLVKGRMALLGGISHDVRTFATRLRLRLDTISDGEEKARAIGDIDDMIRLLDDALLASRAGAGELTEELFEPGEIVENEVRDRIASGRRADVEATAAATTALVLGDRLALRRVVANLAENAMRYGNAAHFRIALAGADLVITVDDEGTGIAPGMREMLLEPFVRGETSRNRTTGGAGLGLAIVRNLVEAHGGTLAIGDAPGGGARFTVRLQVYRPSAQA